MKKLLIFITIVITLQQAEAQNGTYFTRNAIINFTSVAPVEKITSGNKQVNCILNTQTNDLAFKVIVKNFDFDKQGMYDHFNDDYLESNKFPNATFEGKIITPVNYSKNGKYAVVVEGKLTIHGVSNTVKENGTITVSSGKITAVSTFSINLSNYGIIVPNNYIKKISNKVDLNIAATMTPYVR